MSDTESAEQQPEAEGSEDKVDTVVLDSKNSNGNEQKGDVSQESSGDSKEASGDSKEVSGDSKEVSGDSKEASGDSKDDKEAGGESTNSSEPKESEEPKSTEEKQECKEEHQEEMIELKEEEKLEQMENKECGSMDSSLEEAQKCFVDESENPVCCIKIQNPATEQECPNARDIQYDSITKVSKDPDNLSWCASSEQHCTSQLQGKVLWSLEEKEQLIKATRGRNMGVEMDPHKRTPASLPIMMGMAILLLLTVIYCIYHYTVLKKKQRAERYSNRSRKSNRSKGKHTQLVEEV